MSPHAAMLREGASKVSPASSLCEDAQLSLYRPSLCINAKLGGSRIISHRSATVFGLPASTGPVRCDQSAAFARPPISLGTDGRTERLAIAAVSFYPDLVTAEAVRLTTTSRYKMKTFKQLRNSPRQAHVLLPVLVAGFFVICIQQIHCGSPEPDHLTQGIRNIPVKLTFNKPIQSLQERANLLCVRIKSKSAPQEGDFYAYQIDEKLIKNQHINLNLYEDDAMKFELPDEVLVWAVYDLRVKEDQSKNLFICRDPDCVAEEVKVKIPVNLDPRDTMKSTELNVSLPSDSGERQAKVYYKAINGAIQVDINNRFAALHCQNDQCMGTSVPACSELALQPKPDPHYVFEQWQVSTLQGSVGACDDKGVGAEHRLRHRAGYRYPRCDLNSLTAQFKQQVCDPRDNYNPQNECNLCPPASEVYVRGRKICNNQGTEWSCKQCSNESCADEGMAETTLTATDTDMGGECSYIDKHEQQFTLACKGSEPFDVEKLSNRAVSWYRTQAALEYVPENEKKDCAMEHSSGISVLRGNYEVTIELEVRHIHYPQSGCSANFIDPEVVLAYEVRGQKDSYYKSNVTKNAVSDCGLRTISNTISINRDCDVLRIPITLKPPRSGKNQVHVQSIKVRRLP